MKCSIIEAFLPSVNNLKDFLNDVVEYETEEDNLNAKDEMVPGIDVTQKLSKKTNINNDFDGLLGTFTGLKSVLTISPPVGGISKAI